MRGHEWFGPVEWHDSDGTTGSLGADELLAHTEPIAYGASNADVAFVHADATNTPAYPDVNVALQANTDVDAMYRSAADNGRNVSINGK